MSSTDYIDFPIITDPDSLAAAAFAYLQSKFPGWVPNPGNLDTIMIEANARMSAEARDVASAVPRSIFRYFGNTIMGIAPIADAYASADTTWVAIDNSGYTIPAGAQVGVRAAGDELIAFQVVYDIVIPPGSTTTAAGEVSIIAVLPGEDGNDKTGAIELIDPLDWVSSVTIVGTSGGGLLAEDDEVYLNRLAATLQLLTPRPILTDDFAVLAKSIPGVARALAIDGYNPGDLTSNNERMVALALVDAAGEAVSAPIKAQVDALLEGEREVNFVINIIDPTYNLINVTVTYKVKGGYDIADVDDNVEAALIDYLSPSQWAIAEFGEGSDSSIWEYKTTIRFLELTTVVNNVAGVDYITALTFAKNPNALGTADVVMTGIAPLPRPNTITVTGS